MRGTQPGRLHHNPQPGIIPAYAGNTGAIFEQETDGWDHPRVCGEHAAGEWKWYYDKGSSPRMRGTPIGRTMTLPVIGIIPAYAGNTD